MRQIYTSKNIYYNCTTSLLFSWLQVFCVVLKLQRISVHITRKSSKDSFESVQPSKIQVQLDVYGFPNIYLYESSEFSTILANSLKNPTKFSNKNFSPVLTNMHLNLKLWTILSFPLLSPSKIFSSIKFLSREQFKSLHIHTINLYRVCISVRLVREAMLVQILYLLRRSFWS